MDSRRRWRSATLVVALATLWGIRLGIYLLVRNHGNPEDYRYAAMRRRHGHRFAMLSLFTVFLLQGVLMYIVSLPLQVVQMGGRNHLNALDAFAVALFTIGFVFESVGDYQLAKFKAFAGNSGQVMDRGLWRWTRVLADCLIRIMPEADSHDGARLGRVS